MEAVFFYLIIDGMWTFARVPAEYKADVRAMLERAGKGHLVAEE